MRETYVHGHKVVYDEKNAYGGYDYLTFHLDDSEANVFFDGARNKGRIKFEDAVGKNYTLSHSSGVYTIEHRI